MDSDIFDYSLFNISIYNTLYLVSIDWLVVTSSPTYLVSLYGVMWSAMGTYNSRRLLADKK